MRTPTRKTLITAAVVLAVLTVFVTAFSYLKAALSMHYRSYQHEVHQNADSSLGPDSMPGDGSVDVATFETHLPIVVLDMNGEEPKDIYKMVGDGQKREYRDPNVTDPWIPMTFTLVDNPNDHNKITDAPSFVNHGKIKLRGASSRSFQKKQYGIKLLDDEGKELEAPLLGMDADEDWVLSNSILDASQIRNYIAYNLAGQLMPFTPECRFVEMFIKDGDSYNYRGLYLLTEPVKQGKGHVDIQDYNPRDKRPAVILVRDRADDTKTTLSTWASDQQLTYGWFTIKYPKDSLLTPEVKQKLETELTEIEKTLYSDNYRQFLSYPHLINLPSFIDYFVINEYFMNYDSGDNSTYYYQDPAHQLSMGPLWDYDNCWDNYKFAAGGAEYMVMPERPWFERMVRDPDFDARVVQRYKELRKGIFSDKNVMQFIDKTVAYLGNASKRDRSRWREVYKENHQLALVEEGHGYTIDRNRETYAEELVRLKDMIKGHGKWLDLYMGDYLNGFIQGPLAERSRETYANLALAFLLLFIASAYLLGKRVK